MNEAAILPLVSPKESTFASLSHAADKLLTKPTSSYEITSSLEDIPLKTIIFIFICARMLLVISFLKIY